MGKKLDKFRLLMWKNWTLQYRKPLQTAVEIIAPILFSVLLVILRSLVDPVHYSSRIYLPFKPLSFNQLSASLNKSNYLLVYSPSPNEILDRSMNFLRLFFEDVKGYKNSKELEAHFLGLEGNRTFAGVQFDDRLRGQSVLPRHLEVSLRFPSELRSVSAQIFGVPMKKTSQKFSVDRLNAMFRIREWRTNLLYSFFLSPGPRDPSMNNGSLPGYYAEGFLALQIVITQLLISQEMNISSGMMARFMSKGPAILMQRFPHAGWRDDPLLPAMIGFTGILIMLSFVYTCINTVKVITIEKERQLKEAMKIMGLPNWLHWTAWFIKTLLFLLISIIFMIILFKVSWYPHKNFSVFTYASPSVMFLFLLLYMCTTITFCFAISVFFSKANTAATVAGLLWFLSYTPFLFFQTQYDELKLSTKLVASLGFNTAMAYGFQMFLMFEGSAEGIHWNNIWQSNTPDDDLNLGLILIMLIADALIYFIIALYVEAIFPGEYGTPQPWYFPFTYSYWHGHPKCLGKNLNLLKFLPIKSPAYKVVEDFEDITKVKNEFFETNPDVNPGIQIINLRKVFGKKIAVKNLSLNIYENQIHVLLGHNGAGKTTTMSMLTGIIPPTSGRAVVCGYNIRTNMKDIRANLGLCPQHNILFDDLTVKEHIYFFSKLKGLGKSNIDEEIRKYVQLLELQPKIDKKSKTLSGGMKRKLCVCIALCGNSKVVLLDEPTAGMDPSSRRNLWDLLQTQKQGRCILLTTHYMDEADVLGDRISIMANGELKCSGSSFFLKKKYGTGYRLILEKSPRCDPNKVTRFLQVYIPNIQIHSNIASELTYLLSEDHVSVFETMFQNLEANTEKLGIRSFGISLNTLEEVFKKVVNDNPSENSPQFSAKISKTKFADSPPQTKTSVVSVSSKKLRFSTGFDLIMNQFIAMFMKKLLSILRTWILQFIQILIPVSFLMIAIIVSRNMNKHKYGNLPKLLLVLDSYKNPITLVEDDGINPFSKFYFESLKDYDVSKVPSINTTMLETTKNFRARSRKRYIVGASFMQEGRNITTIKAWFNNDPYHAAPLALALVLDAIYKKFLGKDHKITFANYPLPFSSDTKVQRLLKGNSKGFQLAFNIGFSMAFVSSFYVLFYVKERVCKSKHLQFASGVKGCIFWITAFLCDLMTFIVTILAVIITLLCFQEEGFRTVRDLGRMFLILFYFGFSMLPMMYFASYLFNIPSTGYTRMTLFSVFTGVAAFLIVQILSSPELLLKDIADALHWGFLIIPHYSLATGIRDSYTTFAASKMCDFFVTNCMDHQPNTTFDNCWYLACNNNFSNALTTYCCVRNQDYFKWESPGIGRNVLYSFLFGSILFLLLNAVEYRFFSKMFDRLFGDHGNQVPQKNSVEDEDVLREKEKIHSTPEMQLLKDHVVVLKDVTKYYKNFLAVNGLCLGVQQFECFGLLGVNGAGKTTTFMMLTGDLKMTYGSAWIGGFSLKTELEDVQRLIGYCPQFDALLTDLTAKETLTIFGLIRGIPLKECKHISEKLAHDFDFYQHLNKKVKQLSGGNKRKLSTAISLIGDPPVICLDEPTAGMDPVTKRNLWNAICTIRDNGKCLVFTSHSMEECEALCTRLAVMVNGNFECMGSIQHLKNKFAAGYMLTIKLKRAKKSELATDIKKIEQFVSSHFPTATQQEKHQELLTYYIADNVGWSKMFGILERAKNELNIEDYSLGQSNLEQVFLRLTKFQR